jgi:hypothetical protein
MQRSDLDHYDTPRYTIQSLLDNHVIKYPALEPCAGYMAIVNMLEDGKVYSMDIDTSMPVQLHCDYLKREHVPICRTIITNPPFSLAHEIIEKALKDVGTGGEVIMLLRLNFLGAMKRKQFWNNTPLKHIYALSKRPRFIRSGASDEYGWFIWQDGYEGKATIEVI